MKKNQRIFLYVILGIVFSTPLLQAETCDDILARANERVESAEKATRQKKYSVASQLFKEAAWYYEQVASIDSCRRTNKGRMAPGMAKAYRDVADSYDKFLDDKKKYEEKGIQIREAPFDSKEPQ